MRRGIDRVITAMMSRPLERLMIPAARGLACVVPIRPTSHQCRGGDDGLDSVLVLHVRNRRHLGWPYVQGHFARLAVRSMDRIEIAAAGPGKPRCILVYRHADLGTRQILREGTREAQPASAIQASASAPAAMRSGADGSLATRQIASATSDERVIGPVLSWMLATMRSIIGA